MKKNILAENMIRFGTKNINEQHTDSKFHSNETIEIYNALVNVIANRLDADTEWVNKVIDMEPIKGEMDTKFSPLIEQLNKVIDLVVGMVNEDDRFENL